MNFDELKQQIEGEVHVDQATRQEFSRDASIFEIMPQAVVFPKHAADIVAVINFVAKVRKEAGGPEDPRSTLSITARAAGTDMTGGSIGEGIIVDTTKYMNAQRIDLDLMSATLEPGVFYRDFEKKTLPEHVTMPVYPASKSLAAIGGMVMNNCGSENTLRYGQITEFVDQVKMILRDGNEYAFGKLSRPELDRKMAQDDLEGEVYRKTYELIDQNYDTIMDAKPQTTKNSSGYYLWNVYDREADTFDLSKLFTGSQGTLGIMTKAQLRLVKELQHKRLVVLFLNSWDTLPELVNKLLPIEPGSMETFDDVTMKLGLKFMPQIAKRVGESFFRFAFRFWPEALIGIRMFGLPKLVILVELAEDTEELVEHKAQEVVEAVKEGHVISRVIKDEHEAEKYWAMRRESFALLRKSVGDKATAPFVDDICVKPEHLPEVMPRVIDILKEHEINVNIAGHAGSGNLHIIPLMDLRKQSERDKIPVVSDRIYDLVLEYDGTITAEHNDGIIRTPYVKKMFGDRMYELFEETKQIFDPENIFNPGKKVGGTKEYMEEHISVHGKKE